MYHCKLFTLLLLSLLFNASVVHVRSNQGEASHGSCARSYLEKRTTVLEKKLRNEWLIRCLTTYIKDKSEYLEGDILSPRCNLAGIGDMCPVIKTVFKSDRFTLLGPNVGINQARFVFCTYKYEDKEYAIFRMKYEISWLRNAEGGESIILDINNEDKDLYNSAFAVLYMDPQGKFALIGACPDFKVNFIMMDPHEASKVRHNDNLTHIFDDLDDTLKRNNLTSTNFGHLFGDVPAVYKDLTPPYSRKYNWKY